MDKRYDSLGLPIMKKKGGPAKVPPKREAVPPVVKSRTFHMLISFAKLLKNSLRADNTQEVERGKN